jgi:hypothetical protein
VLEYWRTGVLGLKAEMDLIFTLLPLVMRDPNMVYLFPVYQPSIHYSITPILQDSNTPGLQHSGKLLSAEPFIDDLVLRGRIPILD